MRRWSVGSKRSHCGHCGAAVRRACLKREPSCFRLMQRDDLHVQIAWRACFGCRKWCERVTEAAVSICVRCEYVACLPMLVDGYSDASVCRLLSPGETVHGTKCTQRSGLVRFFLHVSPASNSQAFNSRLCLRAYLYVLLYLSRSLYVVCVEGCR